MEPTPANLAEIPFFKDMSWQQLETLSACAMSVRFDANTHIFKTGDVANRFYVLISGKVQLESAVEDGPAIPIQVLEGGDVLGWSWLFPPYHWRFDARTLEPVEAIFLYGTRLREQADQDPALCCTLMKRMTPVILARLQATRAELAKAKGNR